MRNLLALFTGVALTLLTAGSLDAADQYGHGQRVPMFAQADRPPPGQGPGPGRMMDGKMHRGEIRHVEQLRMLKMLELLDLGEDQEVEFITRLRAFRKSLRAINEEKESHVTKLAEGLHDGQLTDSQINDLIDSIREVGDRLRAESGRFIDDCRGMLTAPQLGKLVVFEMKFERELLGRIRAFREEGRMRRMQGEPLSPDEKP